ncbi:lasso peptide biosynthesis B2 protein [Streptomyces sp. NPDC059452]|uniref:lasso peptide biosynthesis B2 protein n=1 Tax=Streptomyces sp. NPDC059452 TaxID=3346835 RepID=UPI0036A013D3
MTMMTPHVLPAIPARDRLVARLALAVALPLSKAPLHAQVRCVRALPRRRYVSPARVRALHTAVRAMTPDWWPGRVACLEISLATVIAASLTGGRAQWVLGARFMPQGAHAWAEVPGGAAGRDEGDAFDRPWTPVITVL